MNTLDSFPAELISLILAHVDNKKDLYVYTLINKSFYKEALPLLWRQLTIHSLNMLHKIITAITTSSHSPGDHVRSLLVGHARYPFPPILNDRSLLTLITHVPLLEHLHLPQMNLITDDSFLQVPRHCPHLITLHYGRAEDLSQESLDAIGQHCHQLSTLHLSSCKAWDPLTTHLSLAALHHCPLKEIFLFSCQLNGRNDNTLALDMTGFHQLTSLQIHNSNEDATPVIVTANARADADADDVVWPQLTHMSLYPCYTLDDAHAIRFIQTHPQLHYLRLARSNHITDRTLDAMSTYLPDLRGINVNYNLGLTGAVIRRLVENCTMLEDGVICYECGISGDHNDFPEDWDCQLYFDDDGEGSLQVGQVKARRRTT